jgi:putative ABC transport system permease protein
VERELADELSFHLEEQIAENRAAGMSAGESRLAALRLLGGVSQIQEECRDMRMTTLVEDSFRDFRHALRVMRKNPAFASASILVLALGIGVNTAIFSVSNAILFRPLPFPEPQQLVRLWDTYGTPGNFGPISYPNFLDWRSWNRSFTALAVFAERGLVLTGVGDATSLQTLAASASFFDVLGVQPALGRKFLPEEDGPGANNGTDSAVISDRLWRRQFGGDPAVLGRSISLSGRIFTIVGVMPPGFNTYTGSGETDVWTTIAVYAWASAGMTRPIIEERGIDFFGAIARLKPAVSRIEAQADMDRIAGLLSKVYPADDPKEGAAIKDLQVSATGDVRPMLLVLLSAAGVVLLIACADVSGLALARVTRRQRELSVRAAIGAGMWRLLWQMLAEGLTLAMFGAILGLGFASIASGFLVLFLQLPPAGVALDWTALAFATAAAVVSAMVFSLAPAIHASRFDLIHGLKEAALNVTGSLRQKRLQSALVVGQIALAMVLLNACGLLTLNLIHLERANLGFEPQNVLTFPVTLPVARYPQMVRGRSFEELTGRLRAIAGVKSAAAGMRIPFRGGMARTVLSNVAGQPVELAKRTGIFYSPITPQYFQSLGIPIQSGREFTEGDTESSAPVVILNEAAAKRYFGAVNPVGQEVQPEMWNGSGSATKPRMVVGVVGNAKLRRQSDKPAPEVYWPVSQIPSEGSFIVAVRTAGDPLMVFGAVREELRKMDQNLPFYDVEPLATSVSSALSQPRYNTALISLFAVLAVILTGVGIYGVIAYSVSQRTHEIGIRIALGALPREVLRQFLRSGLAMGASGVVIGLVVAEAAMRLMRTLVFGDSIDEPITFAISAALLIAVALTASYLPARRATRIDPIRALHYE